MTSATSLAFADGDRCAETDAIEVGRFPQSDRRTVVGRQDRLQEPTYAFDMYLADISVERQLREIVADVTGHDRERGIDRDLRLELR